MSGAMLMDPVVGEKDLPPQPQLWHEAGWVLRISTRAEIGEWLTFRVNAHTDARIRLLVADPPPDHCMGNLPRPC
jgi:hypothetical protein